MSSEDRRWAASLWVALLRCFWFVVVVWIELGLSCDGGREIFASGGER